MTLKEAVHLSYDDGNYPDVIPVDYGLDLKIKTRPDIYVETNKPRKVRIDISTFRGIAAGAVHYYAAIIADGIRLLTKDNNGNITTHMGYICEEFSQICRNNSGKYDPIYKIEVMRELSKKEIGQDPIRWQSYHPGYRTNAFNTKKEAVEQAIKIAKLRFGKGWFLDLNKIK
jgi:hypothetical protein